MENEGMKFDNEKIKMDLICPEFIEGVGEVLTFGAIKYKPDNWKNVSEAKNRYYAAALRHILAYRKGEIIDSESGLSHLKHAATNIMFLLYFEKNDK